MKAEPGVHLFEDHLAKLANCSIGAETHLSQELAKLPATGDPKLDLLLQFLNPLTGKKEFSPLAHQLQMVARLIKLPSDQYSPRRQVFFVGLGGFDTHSRQNQTHALLMARVNHALSYFDTQLGAMRDSVTTFTASDFGRSFTSNGDGTDHGWGGHQFVMGGAVRGGDLYGRFPTLSARVAGYSDLSNLEQLRNGSLLPSTSVDHLGGTLGRWFGLSDTQLATVFPNLKYFTTAPSNMAFLR